MKPVKIFFIIITLIVSVCAVLLVFEILLRIFWSGKPYIPDGQPPFPYYAEEGAEALHTLIPDHFYKDYGFRTNRYGFRASNLITDNKAGDVFRIVVIGDSVTFGFSTKEHLTYPSVLEKQLNKFLLRGIKKVEVVNLGIGGHNIPQYLKSLKKYGLRYQPDLILVGITVFNDFDGHDTYYLGNGWLYIAPVSSVHGYGITFEKPSKLVWNSYVLRYLYYKFVEPRLKRDVMRRFWGEDAEDVVDLMLASCDEDDDLWAEVDDALKGFYDISKTEHVPIIFLLFPADSQVRYPKIPGSPQEIFTKKASRYGFTVIDFYEAARSLYNSCGIPPFKDVKSHPSDLMYEYIGSYCADYIVDNLFQTTGNIYGNSIDVGANEDEAFLSFGWDNQEIMTGSTTNFRWVHGNHARLVFNDFKKDLSSVEIRGFPYAGCSPQTIKVSLNAQSIGLIKMDKPGEIGMYKLEMKKSAPLKKFNTLDLEASCSQRVGRDRSKLMFTMRILSFGVDQIFLQ